MITFVFVNTLSRFFDLALSYQQHHRIHNFVLKVQIGNGLETVYSATIWPEKNFLEKAQCYQIFSTLSLLPIQTYQNTTFRQFELVTLLPRIKAPSSICAFEIAVNFFFLKGCRMQRHTSIFSLQKDTKRRKGGEKI